MVRAKRRGRRRPIPPDSAPPPPPEPSSRPMGPDPEWAYVRPCAICRREARGFGYVHQLRADQYPTYQFCSLRCLDAGAAIAGRHGGVIDKTEMEQRAIKDARRPFAEALTELGLMEHFFDLSAKQINALIDAALEAEHRSKPQRDYLGGSRIGEPCARRLAYEVTLTLVDVGKDF